MMGNQEYLDMVATQAMQILLASQLATSQCKKISEYDIAISAYKMAGAMAKVQNEIATGERTL